MKISGSTQEKPKQSLDTFERIFKTTETGKEPELLMLGNHWESDKEEFLKIHSSVLKFLSSTFCAFSQPFRQDNSYHYSPWWKETEICMMEVIKFHKTYMTHKQIGPIKKSYS